MCGLFGIITQRGATPALSPVEIARRRDLLRHRGPDAQGLVDAGHALLAHRRLAVVDLSPRAAQPMLGRGSALAYNGELYNAPDLRRQLAALGHLVASRSDTEVILAALDLWGQDALTRLRGMFALAYLAADGRILLARDPLGIKPLYWREATLGGREHVLFASEPPALLALEGRTDRPDPVTISAYLSTIRTTLGERTLYEELRTLQPGHLAWIEPTAQRVRVSARRWWTPQTQAACIRPAPDAPDPVQAVLRDSLRRHLDADVPVALLLSGGLDSTILAIEARAAGANLRTYAAGSREPDVTGEPAGDDLDEAARVACALGTRHAEVCLTSAEFAAHWRSLVAAQASPLSTPNEVAIRLVCRQLRADGHVVAISGEGADELFAGYDLPLRAALAFEASGGGGGGRLHLHDAAWVSPDAKHRILLGDVWEAAGRDTLLAAQYDAWWDQARENADPANPLRSHLRFQTCVNLAGLLQRLDSASMREGVEGRTPFADIAVEACARSLPDAQLFDHREPAPQGTKLALRRAYAQDLPQGVASRPKGSFPLPFRAWLAPQVPLIRESPFLRSIVRPEVIEMVAGNPAEWWRLAWPLANLALWGESLRHAGR